MKVLLVHSAYRSEFPSGENRVVEAERSLLERKGVEVRAFIRRSNQMIEAARFPALSAAGSTIWNPFAAREIDRAMDQFKPDVVHVHNTFPWLSPSVFYAAGQRAARVLTLHNYRLFCPKAIPARQGRVCTECIDRRSTWPSLRHACYRDSRAATVPLAFSVALHRRRGTWRRQVDAFIALTEFQRNLVVDAGLPAHKVHVKPNFAAADGPPRKWSQRRNGALFVGRLSEEKGVSTLIQAWRAWGKDAPPLCIVGDGDLRPALQAMSWNLPISFTGSLSPEATRAEIVNARLLVVPSTWFESFPMVIAEAFASGTPVAASNIGPLPGMVKQDVNGVVFQPNDPASLLASVRSAWTTPGVLERLGRGARAAFDMHYTEDASFQRLMHIYQQAIEVSRHE